MPATSQPHRLLSLKTRLLLITLAALIGYPLSIGPSVALMYQTGLVASPSAIWLFSTFYWPINTLESLSPPLQRVVNDYVLLFISPTYS